MKRKYGVNVASLWPWSVGPFGLSNSLDIALRADFDGIQALPMRGLDYENARVWEQYLLSYENAWNYGPFLQVIARHLGLTKNPAAPAIWDYIFFDQEEFPYLPNVLRVEHHSLRTNANPSFALEMHPECSLSAEDYLTYYEQGGKLCWDTSHVRRPRKSDGKSLDWKELLYVLPPKSVSIIHVHPTVKEIPGFLAHKSSELAGMLYALKSRVSEDVTVVLEFFPPVPNWFSYKRTRQFAGELLSATKYHFEG